MNVFVFFRPQPRLELWASYSHSDASEAALSSLKVSSKKWPCPCLGDQFVLTHDSPQWESKKSPDHHLVLWALCILIH